MPRSIEEIDQNLVGMGYYVEDIRIGKCLVCLPDHCISVTQYRTELMQHQQIYNYYRDCLKELNKGLMDPRYELELPVVPDIPGQNMMSVDLYSRRVRTDDYTRSRIKTCIEQMLLRLQRTVIEMEAFYSKQVISDSETFMKNARQLMFERLEAIFHVASERLAQ